MSRDFGIQLVNRSDYTICDLVQLQGDDFIDSLAGRLALKEHLRKRLFITEGLQTVSGGKPPRCYHFGEQIYGQVSISHSNKVGVAAYSGNLIGVDIEDTRAPRKAETLRYIAREEEQVKVTKYIKNTAPLYDIWTAKESVMKAYGLGLAIDPLEISINEIVGDNRMILHCKKESPVRSWSVQLSHYKQYCIAVAKPLSS